MKFKFCPLILFLFFSATSWAQPLSITSITTTNSTCPANGTVTVNATGGTMPYFYSINSGTEQSSNLFQGLASGSYMVKVRDVNNVSVTQTATVGGNYTILNPTLATTRENCPGANTGSITATIGSGQGTSPFVYSIISGPTMPPASAPISSRSYTFSNLAAGNYTIRVTDSCGEFQTRSITLLAAPNYNQTIYSVNARPSTCGSMDFYIRPGIGANFPHTYTAYPDGNLAGTPITVVVNGSDLVPIPGTSFTGFKITGPNPSPFCAGKYAFGLTDACGKVAPIFNLTTGNVTITNNTTSTCIGNDFKVTLGEGWMPTVTVTATPSNPANPTLTQQITAYSPSASNPYGNPSVTFVAPAIDSYTFTVTDACGRVCTYNGGIGPVVRTFQFRQYVCGNSLDSTFGIQFYMNGYSGGSTVSILSGPTSYSGGGITATATYPVTTTIAGTGNQYPAFYNLIPGTYTFSVTDTCGYTQQLTITANPPLGTYTIPDLVSGGCPGSMYITSNSSQNCLQTNAFFADVKNVATNTIVGWGNYANNSFTMQNMPTGTYGITYSMQNAVPAVFTNPNNYPLRPGYGIVGYKEVTISNTVSTPAIQAVVSATCNGQINSAIIVDSAKGVKPYSFAITSGPGGYTAPAQTSTVFQLPSYGTYTFQTSDSCGNSNSTAIDIQPQQPPTVKQTGGACIGQNIVLSVKPNSFQTVSWLKPDNTTFIGDPLLLSPGTTADMGTYTVTVTTTVNGCSEISSKTFTLINCVILPINLLSFTATHAGRKVALHWATASEQNNLGFYIERSTNATNWSSLGFVATKAPNGNSSQRLEYNYTDNAPANGNNYYRLKQIDFDDKYEYSSVRMVKFDRPGSFIIISPNPVSDNVIINGLAGNEKIIIINSLGQQVRKIVTTAALVTIDVRDLKAGVYYLTIFDTHGNKKESLKILKQ